MRRVAITGIGIVSAIGNTADEVAASLKSARSGISFAPEYAQLGFRCQVHAPPRIDWESMVDRRAARFLAQGTAFGHIAVGVPDVAATCTAVRDRAAALGGTLRAAPRADGSFEVVAVLPYDEDGDA